MVSSAGSGPCHQSRPMRVTVGSTGSMAVCTSTLSITSFAFFVILASGLVFRILLRGHQLEHTVPAGLWPCGTQRVAS